MFTIDTGTFYRNLAARLFSAVFWGSFSIDFGAFGGPRVHFGCPGGCRGVVPRSISQVLVKNIVRFGSLGEDHGLEGVFHLIFAIFSRFS